MNEHDVHSKATKKREIVERQRRTISNLLGISVISINQQRLGQFSQRNIHIEMRGQTLGTKEEELSEKELDTIATPDLIKLARQVKGSLGNAHSIMIALKECISENRHRLILEDDTQLHPELSSFIDENWNYIKNLDVLVLGGNTDAAITFEAISGMPMSGIFTRDEDRYPDYQRINDIFKATPSAKATIYKLHKIFGSHAWITSPKGAQKLIESCFPLDTRPIEIPLLPHKVLGISFDRRWNSTLGELDAGICIPFLALTPNNEKISPHYPQVKASN